MVNQNTHKTLQSIRQFLDDQSMKSATDSELLQRFISNNEEVAFRIIVERHGPMVLGVCRRKLRCSHDAEDAFQATFLVFAKQAGSIRKSDALSTWLFGVASRVSAKLQRQRFRSKKREKSIPRIVQPRQTPPEELTWREITTGLDEELQRIPASYRDVLILCYLEGLTRDQAAKRLGVNTGVVKGRLERARKCLAHRLSRRGIRLSAELLVVSVSSATLTTTVRAASHITSNQPLANFISPRVLSLTNLILKGMVMKKAKAILACILGIVILILGVGFGIAQTTNRGSGKVAIYNQLKQPQKTTTLNESNFPQSKSKQTNPLAEIAKESDADYIRRMSLALRGVVPSPTEMYFFLRCKETNKREALVELFLKEKVTTQQKSAQSYLDFPKKQSIKTREILELKNQNKRNSELDLMQMKMDIARINMKEKHLLISHEKDKLKLLNGQERLESLRKIELLQLSLERAELLLREAQLQLESARRYSGNTQQPPPSRK